MRYKNTYHAVSVSIGTFLKWIFGLLQQDADQFDEETLRVTVPRSVVPDTGRIARPLPTDLQITWLGHATFLIQYAGFTILTDPFFGERASPISWAGPKRLFPVALSLDVLPPIDMVLVSHNHYDHLDRVAVEAMNNETHFFVPAGLGAWMRKRGKTNIHEANWWDTLTLRGIHITSTPAQHWSGRGLVHNRSHWCGWLLHIQDKKIYFAGDTGYSPEFRTFREHPATVGIDVALLPIGAYNPRAIMRVQHCTPEEAVLIHLDVGARESIGMHWATLQLSGEHPSEPGLRFVDFARRQHLPDGACRVLAIGETFVQE